MTKMYDMSLEKQIEAAFKARRLKRIAASKGEPDTCEDEHCRAERLAGNPDPHMIDQVELKGLLCDLYDAPQTTLGGAESLFSRSAKMIRRLTSAITVTHDEQDFVESLKNRDGI